jgi:hypothetical protein
MNTLELHEAIEKAGDARDYTRQARIFCDETGAKIEARYIKTGAQFGEDDDARDIYEVRISRGAREYVFTFGNSIKDTEDRLERIYKPDSHYALKEIRKNGGKPLHGIHAGASKRAREWHEQHNEFLSVFDSMAGDRPSAYSILAAMTKYEPEGNVDDFAAEYGYTKPSEALRVFNAVQEEWKAMQSLFTDAELEAMQLIA